MKKLFLISAIATFICACAPSSYYQLYKVSTEGLEQKSNLLTFENEDCIVSYNLWGENGDLSFMLYNKTDKDMFVVMPQSFFIKNDIAYDYYTNAVHTSRNVWQTGQSATLASSNVNILGNSAYGRATTYAQAATAENSTITTEKTVICIPPRAAKIFMGFNLITTAHKDCDDYDFNYPKKVSDIITYTKEDSPWRFRNRLTYTFGQENENYKHIDNVLWVSYLQNYYYTEMQEQIKVTPCELSYTTFQTIILNKAPNAFYNKYTKTIGASKRNTASQRGHHNNEVYSVGK